MLWVGISTLDGGGETYYDSLLSRKDDGNAHRCLHHRAQSNRPHPRPPATHTHNTPTSTRSAEAVEVRRHDCFGLNRLSRLRTIPARRSLGCPHVPITAPCSAVHPNCEPESAPSGRSVVTRLSWAPGHVHFGPAYLEGGKANSFYDIRVGRVGGVCTL